MAFYIVCVLCIILIGIIIVPIYNNHKLLNAISNTTPSKKIDSIRFRTGDIILYRWNYSLLTINKNGVRINDMPTLSNTMNNFLVSCVYGNTFFHVGVVVVWNDVPYILELTETDTYCNYDNGIAHYVPSLSSMDDMLTYRGIICHFPYIGREIDNSEIHNILKTKNEYLHAWHPDYGLIKNWRYYFYDDMPELETCGPLNKKLSKTNCPRYVNCVQYICSVLYKMGIRDIDKCMRITPNTLFDFCLESNLYTSCSLIETPYLLEYV